MKEKLLLALKTKFEGVQDAILNRIAEKLAKTVKEETEVTTAVEGVTLQSLIDSYGDSRATEAQQTAVKTFREKHGLDENGKPIKKDPEPKPGDPKPGDPKPDPDMPAWARKLQEDNEALRATIEKQEQDKTRAGLAEKVTGHEKLKGIPKSFFKGRNLIPESEDKIDTLITEIETDWNSFKQEQAELGVIISIPGSGEDQIKLGGDAGKAAAAKRNTGSEKGVETKKLN